MDEKEKIAYEKVNIAYSKMQDSLGDDIVYALKNPDAEFHEKCKQAMREAEERRAKSKSVETENTQELYSKLFNKFMKETEEKT